MPRYHVIAMDDALAAEVPRHPAGARLPAPGARRGRYDPAAGFPPSLRDAPLTLNAYGADRTLVGRERTHGGEELEAAVDRLLDAPGVGYIHVRSTRAGCFLFRLDPVPAAA